jgi:hypothetical protein
MTMCVILASDLAVDVKQDESLLLTSLLDVKHDDDVFLASDLVVRSKAR